VIEEIREQREQEFFTHTASFLILVVLWSNLIVRVQTAARGAVCVCCRSRLEHQEQVLRVTLQRTQSRRRDRERYKAIPPLSSCRQDQQFSTFLKTPKYKTIGCFDKTTGCFSLILKNNFHLKGLRMLMLWIQSRVDYT